MFLQIRLRKVGVAGGDSVDPVVDDRGRNVRDPRPFERGGDLGSAAGYRDAEARSAHQGSSGAWTFKRAAGPLSPHTPRGAILGRCRSGGHAAHSPAPATAGWLLPGPGWPWVLAAVTSVWQCGHVSTGAVMFPQVSWTSRTGGPPGVGAHWSPQVSSAVPTGKRARPFSVRWYS